MALCAPSHAETARAADYLSPDQRSRVNQLIASLDLIPTNATNAKVRADLAWEWMNAYAINGGYLPVNATLQIAQVNAAPEPNQTVLDGLDATIRELAYLDANPEGLGTLVATPGPYHANSLGTIRQTYTVGKTPIQTGGAFLLGRHFMTNFGPWQTQQPDQPNYVSIESSNPRVSFVAGTAPLAGMHGGWRSTKEMLTFRVAAGTLETGDTVTISWGDQSQGSPGMQMPSMSSERIPLPIYLAFHNGAPFYSLPIQPIRIEGGAVSGVKGFAPSIVAAEEAFFLSVRAQDAFYNRATGPVPDWQVNLNGEPWLRIPAQGAITKVQVSLPEPGIYYAEISSEDGTVTGTVNPILVEATPDHRIAWGDTHGHSGFAEGIGTPDQFMRWARDDARLDFVTHSEHDVWMDDQEWQELIDNVRKYSEPGQFIPFLGYEWSIPAHQGGHHNVLFRTPEGRQRIPAQFYSTLSRLYAGLRQTADPQDVLTIPHAHQAGDYRQSDPELQSLVEIASQHGNFEWFGRLYLQHGHQVGFTAASDTHLSQPGYSMPVGGSLKQTGGLGAVQTKAITVDAIFDSMKALRSYATTGERIILKFRLNGADMGQRTAYSERRKINAQIIGTKALKNVAVIKNDSVIWQQDYAVDASARSSKAANYMLSFASESAPEHPGDNPRGWRYWDGTLTIENAELVSIEAADPRQILQRVEADTDANRATFRTQTRGNRSTFYLNLKNVQRNAKIEIDLTETREAGGAPPIYRPQQRIPAESFAFALKDLENGQISHNQSLGTYTDTTSLVQLLTEETRHTTISLEDEGTRHGDYYYLRVEQIDGSTAWSSPIWVGGHRSR